MLDNSFKYNRSMVKRTSIYIIETNDNYILHIKDNGEGIEETNKAKLFDKFFRADQTKTLPGLGLGLYYVKQCLDLHGWNIKINSHIGSGTEFMVHIPKKPVNIIMNTNRS